MKKIVLLGSGGHAKSVVDSLEQKGEYEIAGFLDVKGKQTFSYHDYQVIGTDDDIEKLYKQGIRYAFITIGYLGKPTARELLYDRLQQAHFQIPFIIDASVHIANDVVIGEGTFIGKHVIVNAEAKIGKMCIINSGAIIEHDCQIGNYSHIAVGAVLCGEARIEEKVFIGANATLIQGIQIGREGIIGAGSVVIQDVPAACTVVGNPARKIN